MIGFWPLFFLFGFVAAGAVHRVARKLGSMAMVDLIWTFGLGLGAVAYATYHHLLDEKRVWLVLSVALPWSLRLGYHLLKDRVLRGEEDPRYRCLADYWGPRAPRRFLFLFLAQVPFVAVFLLPITAAMRHAGTWQATDFFGVLIAVGALSGEAIADRQLARFRADPSNTGEVFQKGFWRYSRHPNYFFEWLHWWAYVAFAWGGPYQWLSLIGPVAMYVFLRHLTGIPHAEKSSLKRRGEAYRIYRQTTSPFFPWIPRSPRP